MNRLGDLYLSTNLIVSSNPESKRDIQHRGSKYYVEIILKYTYITTSSVSVGNPHIMSVAMEISETLKKRHIHCHFTEECIN